MVAFVFHHSMGLNKTNAVFGVGKQQSTDQPAQISAFVIPLLENIMSRLATSEISIF